MTRDVQSSGTGGALVGKKVRQLPGLIGWSACVNSGAQVQPDQADQWEDDHPRSSVSRTACETAL